MHMMQHAAEHAENPDVAALRRRRGSKPTRRDRRDPACSPAPSRADGRLRMAPRVADRALAPRPAVLPSLPPPRCCSCRQPAAEWPRRCRRIASRWCQPGRYRQPVPVVAGRVVTDRAATDRSGGRRRQLLRHASTTTRSPPRWPTSAMWAGRCRRSTASAGSRSKVGSTPPTRTHRDDPRLWVRHHLQLPGRRRLRGVLLPDGRLRRLRRR